MNVIEVENLSKKYLVRHEKPMLVKDLFLRPFRRRVSGKEFWALRGISFEVKKGETLGIIGANGAGKSTLLKILTRVTRPTSGTVRINGRVGALLELGAGFHPDLTGRENIYLNGSILGLRRKEIEKGFDEIVEFSGVRDSIDAPVRTYSSGMFVRLGFATAVHLKPEILLVDEVLAVGDEEFQRKCMTKMAELRESERTIVLVSHSLNSIKSFCSRVIWIENGMTRDSGISELVVSNYLKQTLGSHAHDQKRGRVWGSKDAEIIEITLCHEDGHAITEIGAGEEATVILMIRFNALVENPIIGVIFKDVTNLSVYGMNTAWRNMTLGSFPSGAVVSVRFKQRIYLTAGSYHIDAGIAYSDGTTLCYWQEHALEFSVRASEKTIGIANLNSQITVERHE